MRVRVRALGMMLCGLLAGSASAMGSQAPAPLITLGVPLPLQQGLKATKIRGVKAGQVTQVEVFGEDIKGASGFKAVLTYDPTKLKFAGFTATQIIPGLTGLNQDDARGTVEIGGASLEGAAAVEKGSLGVIRFEALAGFSGRADITLKSSSVIRAEGRKDSGAASVFSLADDRGVGPIALDLDLSEGKASEVKGARAGQVVEVEVSGEDVKGASGYRVVIGYDAGKLKFAGFTATQIIPGLSGLSLPDSAKGTVEIGGASVEGTSAVDRGRLGVLRLEVLAGFSGVADVALNRVTVIRPEGRRDFDGVSAWKVSITEFGTGPEPGPAGLASDFDGNGVVDFDDFFPFADAFGAQQGDAKFNATFDLNKNGSVDFDDFFIFAGDFGKTTK